MKYFLIGLLKIIILVVTAIPVFIYVMLRLIAIFGGLTGNVLPWEYKILSKTGWFDI